MYALNTKVFVYGGSSFGMIEEVYLLNLIVMIVFFVVVEKLWSEHKDLSKEAFSIASSEGQNLVNAISNYLCLGSIQGFRKVSVIIDSNLEVLKHHAMLLS
jgi:hypothetical protein